jgi:DNA-binding PadR family transcriptional regulator
MRAMSPTPLTVHILLVLALGDHTPTAILRQIVEDSQGTLLPRDGAFYKALHRLEDGGFIAPSPGWARACTLTPHGRQILRIESVRYQAVAMLMRARRV